LLERGHLTGARRLEEGRCSTAADGGHYEILKPKVVWEVWEGRGGSSTGRIVRWVSA
jgi:hypothetical protein